MREIFRRSSANPVVTQQNLPFNAAAVYNPGATEQDDEIVLLVRVEDDAGYSDIHVARSTNGVSDWRIDPELILKHGEEQ